MAPLVGVLKSVLFGLNANVFLFSAHRSGLIEGGVYRVMLQLNIRIRWVPH